MTQTLYAHMNKKTLCQLNKNDKKKKGHNKFYLYKEYMIIKMKTVTWLWRFPVAVV
jgi:hypothetical protein